MPVTEEQLALIPRPNPAMDVRSLRLDAKQGFILSRIDGLTSTSLLCDLLNISGDELVANLQYLESSGAIIWQGKTAPVSEDGTDLTGEELDKIRDVERHIAQASHWLVLGLHSQSTSADIKRAYFSLSKLFHPDRYYGRNLGTYRERLEKVFHGIKKSYDVLSNDNEREAYRQKVPPPVRPTSAPTQTGAPGLDREQILEERRQQILKQRRKSNPLQPHLVSIVANVARATEKYQAGMTALRAGNSSAALANFKLAAAYDPGNVEYADQFRTLNDDVSTKRAQEMAERAEKESPLNPGEAARLFSQASDYMPQKTNYAVRAGEELLRIGDLESAWEYVQRALRGSALRADVQLLAGLVLAKKGDKVAARQHLEEAGRLEPANPRVRDALASVEKSR